ncbi:hypothetical protein D3C86_1686050 [compost metagenome]
MKLDTPSGKPDEVVFAAVGLAIAPAPVHNKVVVALIVSGVDKIGGTGTLKVDADCGEHVPSLIGALIAPELYEIVVGEPQKEVKFEKVIVAFVNAPMSPAIQS